MAKPKISKAKNEAKETISTSSPQSETKIAAATASPVVPAPEAKMTETAKTEKRTAARKPAIVRTEPRANLVPINLEDEIRRLAYLLSERRGFESGHETEDWLAAEREVRQRYHQQSA